MVERDPKYTKLVEDIGAYVNRLVDQDKSDAFGSMVLISCPRDRELMHGDVKGWAAPEVKDKHSVSDLLMMAFFSLTTVLLGKEKIDPQALHKLVMAAAIRLGVAAIIVVDEEGNAMFNGVDDDDIPQA